MLIKNNWKFFMIMWFTKLFCSRIFSDERGEQSRHLICDSPFQLCMEVMNE